MNSETINLLRKSQRLLNWNNRKLYIDGFKKNQRRWAVKRGEVYFVDFGENIGSEENKLRPCVVLQSNSYNFRSPVFTCAIISNSPSTIADIQIPIKGTYLYIDEKKQERQLTGTIDLGQIKTVAKERIVKNVGMLKDEVEEIDQKLFNEFGLTAIVTKKDNLISSLQGKVKYLSNNIAERDNKIISLQEKVNILLKKVK